MNREALKARHVDARAPVLSVKVSWKPVYFAPSALRHVAIAAPGPLGRAITFRALGAQTTIQIRRLIRQVY
jgi:hypothetical protein